MSVWLAIALTTILVGGFFTLLLGITTGWDRHEMTIEALVVVGAVAAVAGLVFLVSQIWNAVLS